MVQNFSDLLTKIANSARYDITVIYSQYT